MKKQFFIMSSLLLASGLYAANMNDVFNEVRNGAQKIFDQAFGVNHANAISSWEKAFNNAKTFVIANSKDLFGRTDSTITTTMNELDQINRSFVSALNTINSNLATAPISRLLPIATNAKKNYDKIYVASFTLGNKKDAREILLMLARFLEDASKKLYDKLLIKGELPPKPPTRPLPPVPGR